MTCSQLQLLFTMKSNSFIDAYKYDIPKQGMTNI